LRFLTQAVLVFLGILALVALVDLHRMMRKTAGMPSSRASVVAQTSLFRVPQIAERVMPFSILVAAMSCYPVCRAGSSSWWRGAPACRPGSSSLRRLIVALLLGVFATLVYNPVAALAAGALETPGSRVPSGATATRACQNTGTVFGCGSATTTVSRSSTR